MDLWEKARKHREQELAASGTGGATQPQASASVATNPGPLETSQNHTFPGNGEADDDSLPSYEEQASGGVDPLTKPGCAQ
eukprot:1648001-Karenia_brevis.AAC.1